MVSLKPYNTFGLSHFCEELHVIHNERDIQALIPFAESPKILGGGSNLLLTRDISTPILLNEIKGKEMVKVDSESVIVKLGGGEIWHEAVQWTLDNNLGGIENLSYIPGKCGAAPIQNIGAYGVELENVFERLDAIDLDSGKKRYFDKDECLFGYRDSIFKNELKGKYFILQLYIRLSLPKYHNHVLTYAGLSNSLAKKGINNPTIQEISETVVEIRKSKLPDPKEMPNCGSFFKNPVIELRLFERLRSKYPDIPSYPHSENKVKVPAGWLIEQCGWKGEKSGGVGCHKDHALVICNYEAEYGRQIVRFYKRIVDSVVRKYGVVLEPEVNIW